MTKCGMCGGPEEPDRILIRVEDLQGKLLLYIHGPVEDPSSHENDCYRKYLDGK